MRWSFTEPSSLVALVLFSFVVGARSASAQREVTTLPPGQVGKDYSQELKVEGGTAPFKWKVAGGTLPAGLRLTQDGTITGVPTTTANGPFVFDLNVTESSKAKVFVVQRFSITVEASQLRIIVPSNAPPPGTPPPTPGPTPPPPPGPATSLITYPPNPNCWTNRSEAGVCGGQVLRTIVGFEQAGVSGAQSNQHYFLDLLYDRPLRFKPDPDLGPALRGWGNLRITSAPQQITTSVAQFASDFAQQVGQLKVNEVAQSFEFLGGIEFRIHASERKPLDFAGPDPGIHHRVSVNFILGGGVITPLSPKDSVQIFDVPTNQPGFFTTYPQANGKQFVAFSVEDRNRFFRQAYGGLRLKTHYLYDAARTRFPETFDLTYGFNESVTGGRIHGGVLRLEGFVPLPYSKASWIYLFGTGIFKPGGKPALTSPFLLDEAPKGTLPTNSGAVVIATPQADRDYYRVGFGIDFVDLIANWKCNFTSDPATKQQCGKQ